MTDEKRRNDLNVLLGGDTEITTRISERELRELTALRAPREDKNTQSRLVVLSGSDAGKVHLLKDEILVGRDLKANIRVADNTVSRKHARIRKTPSGKYTAEDLGSQNGTWLNGTPVLKPTALKVGDKIRIGAKTVFLFTQQDNIESHLLELRKMESLGRLARGIAHDFNNLLATVMLNINYIEVMSQEGTVDLEELAVSIDQTKVALKQAANMTEQLLGFARKGRYDERPRNISAIVEETVSLVRRTFDRAVSIKTQIEPDLWVVGDQSQLIQVFMNLCINARDAMPEGGTLTISARKSQSAGPDTSVAPFIDDGPFVVVSVRDTGVGMNEETVQHIFEPFFSTKGLGKGNGLGLATVYGVVKNHGGEIRVKSTQGEGTLFTVFLPATHASSLDVGKQSGRFPSAPPAQGLILLVEDDEQLRNITEKTLVKLGYKVKSCADGKSAVRLYDQLHDRIRLVLLDLILPEMGGAEVFRRIRKRNPEEKVVIISGYSEDQQLRDLMNEGARAFIKKPCSAERLAGVIAETLHNEGTGGRATISCGAPSDKP